MDKYAIYLRKSRADLEAEKQGQFETLRLHQERLTALAEQRQYNIVKTYRELVSGDSIAARPEMQALLKAVEKGEYTGVLVTEVSRLARGDTKDQGTVSEAFKESGTLIITPDKIYDPQSPQDEDFFDFSLFMARQEYKYIRRRMQASINQLREQGKWLATYPPYGYDKIKHSLRPNDKAPVVQRIFADFISGKSSEQIAVQLLRENIPSAKGGIWDSATIVNLLHNEAYCGISVLHKIRKKKYYKDGILKSHTVRNDPSKWVRVQGNWPAIIDPEIFQKAQDQFGKTPKVKHTGAYPKNPLAGLLRCADCGYVMKMQFDTRNGIKARYQHRIPSDCFQSGIALSEILPEIEKALLSAINDSLVTLQIDAPKPVDLAPLRAKLSELKNREKRIYDAYESGVYSMQELMDRRDELQTQITDQLQTIAAAEKTNASYIEPATLSISIHQA
ncbi:MAG: recombinase family protein, partial [Lachnospiraceae bacterium]|nr:recombinase family protein [Lachnospiraceae bacterium]